MYTLTLNQDDRRAIDWIGDRYSHGNDLKRVLVDEAVTAVPDQVWESDLSITYHLPESKAWQVKEIVEDGNLDCINPDSHLAVQLTRLVMAIV